MCVEIYTKEPPSSCSFIVPLVHSDPDPVTSAKEIFHFKWGLIGNVVGFLILPTAGYKSLTLLLHVS